jgi:hypothetical protein
MEVTSLDQVKMTLSRMSILALTFVLTLSACGLGAGTAQAPGTPMGLPSGVETRSKEALGVRTGIAVEEIEVVKAEQKEWPDACLGLAEEGEACAKGITPG